MPTTPLGIAYPTETEAPDVTQLAELATTADAAITAARDRHNGAWAAYTPTWFNAGSTHSPIGVGNGSLTGGFLHVGRTVHFWIRLVRGATSGQGVTRWALTLPVQPRNSQRVTGIGVIEIAGYPGPPVFFAGIYSGTYGPSVWLRDAAGFLNWGSRDWSAGDAVLLTGTYEAATDGA